MLPHDDPALADAIDPIGANYCAVDGCPVAEGEFLERLDKARQTAGR